MSVRDAKPGDIYLDAFGNVWKVVSTCTEPTVHMMMLDDRDRHENDIRPHQHGGVSGLQWQGFKRVVLACERWP